MEKAGFFKTYPCCVILNLTLKIKRTGLKGAKFTTATNLPSSAVPKSTRISVSLILRRGNHMETERVDGITISIMFCQTLIAVWNSHHCYQLFSHLLRFTLIPFLPSFKRIWQDCVFHNTVVDLWPNLYMPQMLVGVSNVLKFLIKAMNYAYL